MSDETPPADYHDLGPDDLEAFARALQDEDVAIVGGQALNVWAELLYPRNPDAFVEHAPFTSRDIDYLGTVEAAYALADKMNGRAVTPDQEDLGPNTAIVFLPFGDRRIRVDFLASLAGVDQHMLMSDRATVTLEIPGRDLMAPPFEVHLVHPLVVLMSRAGNIVTLRRSDARSLKQMRAAVLTVGEYIAWRLDEADHKEAVRTVQDLLNWIERSTTARDVREFSGCDPLDAIEGIETHSGWHPMFRDRTLVPQRDRIRERLDRARAEAERRRAGRPA